MRVLGTVLTMAVLALVASGCGDDGDAVAEGPHEIVATDFKYEPANLKIAVGDRVSFVNRSDGKPHSANAEYGVDIDPSPGEGPTDHSGKDINHAWQRGFATHALFTEEAQTVVFHVARKYEYVCSFYPEMKGTIEVVEKDG